MLKDYDKELFYNIESLKCKIEELKNDGIEYIYKVNINSDMPLKNNKMHDMSKSLQGCNKCKLSECRANIVFGSGDPQASLVFVGEAPGENEDLQGEPFVGRAGQLLTKMIQAMGFSREEVYICNVIKCRPPSNRNPEKDEIEACEPFLKKQLEIIEPKVIVGLGTYACQTLLQTQETMSKIRGSWKKYENIDFMPTFHPAYLLRNPPAKKLVWEDLQEVMKKLKN